MKRAALSHEVTVQLWGRAAGRCQFAGCHIDLTSDTTSRLPGNFADRAHVHAVQAGGPRGQTWDSSQAANEVGNLMLLCQKHHRLIDRRPGDYAPAALLLMKADHEARVKCATNFLTATPSHVLVVRGAIGAGRVAGISREDIWQALTVDGKHPATDSPLTIDLSELGYTDGDQEYWATCEVTLRRRIEALFAEHGSLNKATHISLFALAPMPVLMVIGKLLGDTRPISIYQYDRFRSTWCWANNNAADTTQFTFRFDQSGSATPEAAALTIGLSANVDPALVESAMGSTTYDSVQFSTPLPGYSIIRKPADLKQFQIIMRECLNEIESRYGPKFNIHVFPAMPASTATQFGRLLLPKSSPGIRIYDHQRDANGFTPTLWLCSRR